MPLQKRANIAALLLFAVMAAKASSSSQINPVGVYVLPRHEEKVVIQNEGESKKTVRVSSGFSGVIKVVRIDEVTLLVDLNGNKGFPSFNQGGFNAPLSYKDNTAVYAPTDYDKSCVITMKFTASSVIVSQTSEDPNTSCGFGHAVAVDGVYKKTSSRQPKIPKDQ